VKDFLWLLISLLFLLNPCLSSFAQEHSHDAKDCNWNELYKSVVNEYGFDQVLVNGIHYEDGYWGKEGHPFLFEDQLYKGTLIFRGREYKGVDIKYDIFKQQVILFIMQNNSIAWIIPPNDFISAFSLGDKLFVKRTFQGVPGFYQVVFDTEELKCLYYWSKSRFGSDHLRDYYSFRFTDSDRKTYLIVDDVIKKYSDNRSFVRLFPRECQMRIKQYIKNNRIKVAKSSDAEIEKLVTYCSTLL
jgi:hypothetical protein